MRKSKLLRSHTRKSLDWTTQNLKEMNLHDSDMVIACELDEMMQQIHHWRQFTDNGSVVEEISLDEHLKPSLELAIERVDNAFIKLQVFFSFSFLLFKSFDGTFLYREKYRIIKWFWFDKSINKGFPKGLKNE